MHLGQNSSFSGLMCPADGGMKYVARESGLSSLTSAVLPELQLSHSNKLALFTLESLHFALGVNPRYPDLKIYVNMCPVDITIQIIGIISSWHKIRD